MASEQGAVLGGAVLVTGGAGYVGSHTLAALLDAHPGARLVVIDNCANAYRVAPDVEPEALNRLRALHPAASLTYHATDIRDQPELERLLRLHRVWCVIHFAALKAVGESVRRPLDYYSVNVGGTCSLLAAMQATGVRRLVYSSSCTVYGAPQYLPLDEAHPAGHSIPSPYGKTKYMCEEMMRDLVTGEPGLRVISLRYFNPVGAHPSGSLGEDPAGEPNNLMPYIAQVAVGRRAHLTVHGDDYDTPDGTGVRDYVHVMDLAEGHERALRLLADPAGPSGFTPVNLGTGRGHSVVEMVRAFEAASGRVVPLVMGARREGDVAAVWAGTDLAESLLGWRAKRSLQDMCADTWRWQSTNPHGYQADKLLI